MNDTDPLIERLDRLIAITTLANQQQIAEAAAEIRNDPVASAILDASVDWTPSGSLQEAISSSQAVSTRTVRSRISELASRGLLSSRGGGRSTEYKSSGII